MRALLLTPLLTLAAPVMAQSPADAPSPYYVPPAIGRGDGLAGAMTDPKLPAAAGRMAGALTRALMKLPVGELQAAIDGRPVTSVDRQRTVGDEVGRDAPGMDRAIERQVASSAGAVQSSARAIQRSLPALLQALGQAAAEIDRVTANLPDSSYPRR